MTVTRIEILMVERYEEEMACFDMWAQYEISEI